MKNHLKFIKIALSIIVISLYNSCRHEDALFPYTQQGLNRASFLLDNRAHKIDNVSYGDNFFFSYMSNDSNLYGVLLIYNLNLVELILKQGHLLFLLIVMTIILELQKAI